MQSIPKHMVENMVNSIWIDTYAGIEEEMYSLKVCGALDYFCKEVISGWHYADAQEIADDIECSEEVARFLLAYVPGEA